MKASVAVLLLCLFAAVLGHAAGIVGVPSQVGSAITNQEASDRQPLASNPSPMAPVPAAPVQPATQPTPAVVSPVPQDATQALVLFGGDAPASWSRIGGNGWVFRGAYAAELRVPAGFRIDYTAVDGMIFSCADRTGIPGKYGPLTVATAAATIWYVPHETACPG